MPRQHAHDLRNLLTIVVGRIDLARREPDCPESVKNHLEDAYAIGLDCFDIVKSMSDEWLTPDAAGDLDPKQFDLSVVAAKFGREFTRYMAGLSIALELELAQAPLMIDGDGLIAFIALLNLALNARDAIAAQPGNQASSPEPKRPGRIAIKTYQRNGRGILAISDNGIGFDTDILSSTEPLAPIATASEPDRGHGLAIVRKSIVKLRGTMDCVSHLGKGTLFTLSLPLAKVAALAEVV